MITSLSSRPNNHHRYNSNFLSPNTTASLLNYVPGSSAEQTIVSHQPGSNPKPLVIRDDVQYPVNPKNGYTSKWPATFRGCLGCGQSGHHFNSCPQSAIKSVRLRYWQELWCHIPNTRRQNREARLNNHTTNSSLNPLGSHQDNTGRGRGRGVNTPAWINRDTHRSPTPLLPSPGYKIKDKESRNPWILPMLVGLNNVNAKGITLMPIIISNNLPCVDFQLDTGTCKTPCLRALVDSGAAIYSGNL